MSEKSKADWLLESLDKDFVKELLEEWAKEKGLPDNKWQGLGYDHKGHHYQFRRLDIRIVQQLRAGTYQGQTREIPKISVNNKAQNAEWLRALREGGYLGDKK